MNFVTFVIMLNLFLLVTLEQYDQFVKKDENPIETFYELLLSFQTSWNFYSSEIDNGFRIKTSNVSNFLNDLFKNDIIHLSEQNINLSTINRIKKYEIDLKLLKYF